MAAGDRPAESSDEVTERRVRASTVVVISVLLAVGLVAGLGFAITRILADGERGDVAVRQPDADVAANDAAPRKVLERTTEHGIELRVHVTDEVGLFGGFEGEGRPGWCEITGLLQATAVAPEAVATTQVPLTRLAPRNGNIALLAGGMIEGAPLWGVLAQVGPDVVTVNARGGNGAVDTMAPVGGVVALAMPAPADLEDIFHEFEAVPREAGDELSVQLERADGTTTFVTMDELVQGPALWIDPECQDIDLAPPLPPDLSTPPGSLPAGTGLQPADPAAARGEIDAAMEAVYAPGAESDVARLTRIDDPGGVQYALDKLRELRGNEPAIGGVEIRELVFLSELEASYFYRITLDGQPRPPQYGRARFVDGAWKVTRATFCQDLLTLGWDCGP
jgi:hypothetical protein